MQWIESLGELFFPHLCVTCNRKLFQDEKFICLPCMLDLPRTGFHKEPENRTAQLFWGRVHIKHATSWLYFRKGSRYQQLVHHLKYKGLKELGHEMGYQFGTEISESPFASVDLVVPVPLHSRKERKRGYNQSEWIARGISEVLQKPLSTGNLVRIQDTPTQTRKNRFERWQNTEGIFTVLNPEVLKNKHILVVDDVVTTGSTLEAAAACLADSGAGPPSLATLAIADV